MCRAAPGLREALQPRPLTVLEEVAIKLRADEQPDLNLEVDAYPGWMPG
jgi:hypothetical protein